MGLFFRSLRSGSSGNCLLISTPDTRVLVDCGFRTKCLCQEVVDEYAGGFPSLDGVIVTHAHGDHLGRYPLKLLSENGVSVRCHRHCLPQIRHRLDGSGPRIETFDGEPFAIGDFVFRALEVTHGPDVRTFGFEVKSERRGKWRKLAIFTDFCEWDEHIVHAMTNADFVYIESNYDPDLERRNPNYYSRYHMSNERAAELLRIARRRSDFPPGAVMLGHLSEKRNREQLALRAVEEEFSKNGERADFDLLVAPRHEASLAVRIRG